MSRKTTQAIKTRQNKLTRLLKKLPDLGQSIWLMGIGLLLGTVFTVLMNYTQGPVTLEEARPVSAVMEDVRGSYSRHRSRRQFNAILIRFEDYEQLGIVHPVATEALLDKLLSVAPGTTFDMLVHPNSATILALTIGGEEIVRFDDAMTRLSRENTAFLWMGIFLYALAALGLFTLILRLKLHRY